MARSVRSAKRIFCTVTPPPSRCLSRRRRAMANSSAQEEATLIFRPQSIVQTLPLTQLFPVTRPLEVELGAGDGSLLIAYSSAHRDKNFLGVERLLGRLRK